MVHHYSIASLDVKKKKFFLHLSHWSPTTMTFDKQKTKYIYISVALGGDRKDGVMLSYINKNKDSSARNKK